MPIPAAPALPAPAILRREIEDALITWFAATTGLGEERVFWQRGTVVQPSFPFGTLSWLSTTPIGLNDATMIEDLDPDLDTPDVEDVRLSATGRRSVVIRAQVFADPEESPEPSAQARLDAAMAKLSLITHRNPIVAAGLGILSIGGITIPADGQAVAEIRGNVASAVTEDVFSISTVEMVPAPEIDDVIGPFDADVHEA